jgi:ABC-type multidrug transport system fused ATPase/permease subunit
MTAAAGPNVSVAVRSSATAEDLPDASFAGQQETFLNIPGADNVIAAMRHVFASLYNDRAIAYRVHKGYVHAEVALSAGIQRMVRSDTGAAGVMFTLDTESGFDKVVFITSSYGLGEAVVQGAVNPDEFYVYKPSLAAGKASIIRRSLGGKAIKMVFTDAREAGKSVKTVDVREGELLCFLGPSGCGKTTLLRIIAGLESQTAGTIMQAGRDISTLPPMERDYGIVFQSYALFPNLTVADNVAYGLVNRRMPREQRRARVAELLTLVGLPERGAHDPGQGVAVDDGQGLQPAQPRLFEQQLATAGAAQEGEVRSGLELDVGHRDQAAV